MTTLRRVLAMLACALPVLAHAQIGARNTVTTDHVRAELVAQAPDGVGAGKPLWLGLRIAHQPGWHTYWKNAGDSGLPTQLQWTLPAGVTAGDIAWPVPRKIPVGNLANYGYEGTVLLPVPVTVDPGFRPPALARDLDVKLHAEWLVCKQECIPESGDFALKLPLQGSTATDVAAFDAARHAHPQSLDAPAEARVDSQRLLFTVHGLPATVQGQTLDFFAETPEIIQTAAPITQGWQGDTWTAQVPLSPNRDASPAELPVVLAQGGQGWRAVAKVTGTWPAAAPRANVSPALDAALRQNAASSSPAPAATSLITALVGALLGGLILNLMPCVFPVLAIKVLGFARHGNDRRRQRLSGTAYAAGVLLSFLALGAAMLALRAGGEQLGWGFQLQSPGVVAGMAALFTLLGLNLVGVFEIGVALPASVASLQARHPVLDAFLSGVLAVAIASPCTAPFMGAALGLAIGLPAAQALAIFAALGVGMAAPYVAATFAPGVARALPRPGAWMDTFRKLMAFPMFGTVAWLVWVIGQQAGIDAAGALLGVLVALAMLVWALTLAHRARVVVSALALACLAGTVWWTAGALQSPAPAAQASAEAGWQPWTPGRVDELLAQGQPVFVDFTAAWCVTCQVNKRTTLSRPEVMADFTNKHVALLRADWTRRDPAITAALTRLGRDGVPVYVFYGVGKAPVVLSELLSVRDVRAAIDGL